MSDYLTLTEFVPGTKAKAEEVNANFSTIKNALITKASTSGNSSQTFSVANATDSTHAVNKGQLDATTTGITTKINATYEKFCVKSGYTTNGAGDLFNYSGTTITAKVGGTYANLIVSNYKGEYTTLSTLNTLSVSGKTDGTYNIFVNLTTTTPTLYTLANNIYKQPSRPTMVDGDVWLNTSAEPFSAIKYTNSGDTEFLDIPLGTVTIASSTISAITTFPFNQNSFNVNTQTTLTSGNNLAKSIPALVMPNYQNGITKTWGTTYTAEYDGWVKFRTYLDCTSTAILTINSIEVLNIGQSTSAVGTYICQITPVCKGDVYIVTGGSSTKSVIFYPAKGAN